jgi:hypothetical protein
MSCNFEASDASRSNRTRSEQLDEYHDRADKLAEHIPEQTQESFLVPMSRIDDDELHKGTLDVVQLTESLLSREEPSVEDQQHSCAAILAFVSAKAVVLLANKGGSIDDFFEEWDDAHTVWDWVQVAQRWHCASLETSSFPFSVFAEPNDKDKDKCLRDLLFMFELQAEQAGIYNSIWRDWREHRRFTKREGRGPAQTTSYVHVDGLM